MPDGGLKAYSAARRSFLARDRQRMVEARRFVADEMLGRLARYLRVLGYDTVYEVGLPDDALALRASSEARTLVSRDRALCRSTPGSVLIRSASLDEQLRELRRAIPDLNARPEFTRCTICNGPTERVEPGSKVEVAEYVPPSSLRGEGRLFRCRECGHFYWEGSHTRAIRERLAAAWAPGEK
jgi:uncharacterized protein with PIN domain